MHPDFRREVILKEHRVIPGLVDGRLKGRKKLPDISRPRYSVSASMNSGLKPFMPLPDPLWDSALK